MVVGFREGLGVHPALLDGEHSVGLGLVMQHLLLLTAGGCGLLQIVLLLQESAR